MSRWVNIHTLAAVGLLLRTARVFDIWPVSSWPVINAPDGQAYLESGKRLFDTGLLGWDIMMPLYPVITYLSGGVQGVLLLQLILSTLTIYLIYGLANVLFASERTALLAAGIASLYHYFILFTDVLLTEATYTFLLTFAVYLLYKGRYVLGAIILALSILERPIMAPLAPIFILVLSVYFHGSSWKQGLTRCGIYIGIFLLFMAPWWYHNYVAYDEFVPFNRADGRVLYAGNVAIHTNPERVSEAFGHITDPEELNQAMKTATWQYIRQHPAKYFKGLGLKMYRFWRFWFTKSRSGPIFFWYTFIVGGVLFFGFFYYLLFRSRHDLARAGPLLIIIIWFCVIHVALLSLTRYRIPIDGFIMVLSAAGLHHLLSSFKLVADEQA